MKRIVLALFLLFLSVSLYGQVAKPKILILNSYHKDFKWSDVLIEGVKEALLSNTDPEITTLYMDSKRISTPEYFEKILEVYKLQLQNRSYDIVLLVDKFSYEFALKYYDELFTDERLIFSGIEHYDHNKVKVAGLEDKVFGVLEKRAIVPIVDTIATLMPELKKLYIINDRSSNAADTDIFIQDAIKKYKDRFAIDYIRDATMDDFHKKFAQFKEDEAVFFVRFYNGMYEQFYQNHQIEKMINASKLPMFVTDTLFLAEGAVGGKLLSIKQIGIDTGNMMLEMLKHEEMKPSIKINETYSYMFNYEKLREFNLNPKLLNSSYSLVNTPQSFLETHRDFVNTVFILSPALVIVIILGAYTFKLQMKNAKDQEFIIQQSKLAEIGEIISSIAHQWKEPLVEISTLVQEHLDISDEMSEKDKKYLDNVMFHVNYMNNTINDFQQFIKPTSKKVVFDILESINKMLYIVQHNMKYSYIDINVTCKDNINLKTNGYPNELMQSFLNIINNSKDAILVKRENQEDFIGKVNICISNQNKYVKIEISDNGGGIKEKNLKRIFNPYYTDKKKGYGIGLYMAKVIIKDKMSGHVYVNNVDQGAKFTILLEASVEDISS